MFSITQVESLNLSARPALGQEAESLLGLPSSSPSLPFFKIWSPVFEWEEKILCQEQMHKGVLKTVVLESQMAFWVEKSWE